MLCVVIDQFQTSAHLLSATVRNGNLAYRISAPSFALVALSSLSECMIEEERDADSSLLQEQKSDRMRAGKRMPWDTVPGAEVHD